MSCRCTASALPNFIQSLVHIDIQGTSKNSSLVNAVGTLHKVRLQRLYSTRRLSFRSFNCLPRPQHPFANQATAASSALVKPRCYSVKVQDVEVSSPQEPVLSKGEDERTSSNIGSDRSRRRSKVDSSIVDCSPAAMESLFAEVLQEKRSINLRNIGTRPRSTDHESDGGLTRGVRASIRDHGHRNQGHRKADQGPGTSYRSLVRQDKGDHTRSNKRTTTTAREVHQPRSSKEPWQSQKAALKEKFGPEGWSPRKKLSPDALTGIRALHAQFPEQYTLPVLAAKFEVSPEAIRRILRSTWTPTDEEDDDRKHRWFARGEKVWSRYAELGLKPPKRWREAGVSSSKSRADRATTTTRGDDVLWDQRDGIGSQIL